MTDQSFPGNDGYVGAKVTTDGLSDFNATSFIVQQILSAMGTSILVAVRSVVPASGLLPPSVNVQPLVNQVDGLGNAVPHGIIFNIPIFRLQGGANAIIIDPAVGDIGCAVFAMRDISSVKVNRAPSNPGSRRRFDMADGMYFGSFLGISPTQYIQFTTSGINVVSPVKITLTAPEIDIVGNIVTTGTITNNGKHVDSTHEHGGVQTGGSNTGVPI